MKGICMVRSKDTVAIRLHYHVLVVVVWEASRNCPYVPGCDYSIVHPPCCMFIVQWCISKRVVLLYFLGGDEGVGNGDGLAMRWMYLHSYSSVFVIASPCAYVNINGRHTIRGIIAGRSTTLLRYFSQIRWWMAPPHGLWFFLVLFRCNRCKRMRIQHAYTNNVWILSLGIPSCFLAGWLWIMWAWTLGEIIVVLVSIIDQNSTLILIDSHYYVVVAWILESIKFKCNITWA